MIYTAILRGLFRTIYGEPKDVSAEAGTGLVLVADGVGGFDLCGTGLRYVMGSATTLHPQQVRVFPWGHGFGRWYADLSRTKHHVVQARKIAEEVQAWHQERPGRPVFLVGKSGGTGIVVRALEQLPAGSVESVVLLAPALSPRYDLSKALRAVRHEMVVYWSPLDVVVLGAGTWLFGTIDRRRSVSAGLVGFRLPADRDSESNREYEKLRQVRWRPSMIRTGYLGGHIGPDSPAFLRKYILPVLTSVEQGEAGNEDSVKTFPRAADNLRAPKTTAS